MRNYLKYSKINSLYSIKMRKIRIIDYNYYKKGAQLVERL